MYIVALPLLPCYHKQTIYSMKIEKWQNNFIIMTTFIIMNNISSDWVFNFKLSKNIEILKNGKISDSNNIRFIKEDNHLTGFTITIKNSSLEEAEQKSRNRANNLAKIFTIKSGMPIETTLSDYHNIRKENKLKRVVKTLTIKYDIDGGIKNLDINDSNIQNIIHSTKSESLLFSIFRDTIFHYYNNNPAYSIMLGFEIIKGEKEFPNYIKLEVLRNIFTHPNIPGKQYQGDTIELFLSVFNKNSFEYKEFKPEEKIIIIDLESSDNLRKLNQMAQGLIKELTRKYNLE